MRSHHKMMQTHHEMVRSHHEILRSHQEIGFTLIELMIALALAGVVIAGALQLHVAYRSQSARQQQVADMQQSLRVSMEILERAIRAGGTGMLGGKMACGATTLYGFQWWNSNAFPNPPINSAAITNDRDPDQLKVIAAQPDVAVLTADSGTGGNATMSASTVLTTWSAGDLFLTLMPNGSGTTTCLLAATSPPAGQQIAHAAPGPAGLACNSACTISPPATGFEVRHFSTETIFRVIPPVVAPGQNDTPKLAMRVAPILNVDTTTYPWMPIADDIEDMQLALVLQNGAVCSSIDDPAICDPSQAMAVRITLVARSSVKEQGTPPSPQGGFEDSALTQASDGYLRRSMTTEIVLRN